MRKLMMLSLLAMMLTAASRSASAEDLFANHPDNTWVKQSPRPDAPSPRLGWEGSADYDPVSDKWIHHGGHDTNPQGFVLFTWDPQTGKWMQHFPNTSPPGVCCVDGSNVFDRARGKFVRFPGASMGHGWQWSRSVSLRGSDVWLYDLPKNQWTNMRPLPLKQPAKYSREVLGSLNSSGTYDPVHELSLSFGGQTTGGGSDALYAYDAYANDLIKLETENRPGRRDGSGLAYDSDADCLIMFGSQYSSDEKTWIYDYRSNKWTGHELDPHPPGKKGKTYSTIPKMAYDPLHKITLCLTWDPNGGGHETWAFDKAAMKWEKMNTAVEPDPSMSRSRNLGFDIKRNLFILDSLTGGAKKGEVQIWTYRYKPAPADKTLAAPADLTCATDAAKATLAWKPVAGADSYHVYRAQSDKPHLTQMAKVATVSAPSYVDQAVEPGKLYFYQVRAVDAGGVEGKASWRARTAARVPASPVVSVLGPQKIELAWSANPESDLVGYNVYRAPVTVSASKEGGKPGKWGHNSPAFDEPVVTNLREVGDLVKLNDKPLTTREFTDTAVDLNKPAAGEAAGGYNHAVYAYVVRAVNKLGVESGNSPFGLTIPSVVQDVMLRETKGGVEVKWSANPEKDLAGYLVFRMPSQYSILTQLTPKPITATNFTHGQGGTARYFIVAVDKLGQQGVPSAPAWSGWKYDGFFAGDWHQ